MSIWTRKHEILQLLEMEYFVRSWGDGSQYGIPVFFLQNLHPLHQGNIAHGDVRRFNMFNSGRLVM